ncbi:MAG: serine/threonine protein kinase [Planctomycetia bacterium]|nr:serine/threonine protein kinase [Planctomycetia bacterium]
MALSVPDFWKLLVESRLLSAAQAEPLKAAFAQMPGAAQAGNSLTLSEWLVSQHVISRYQATVLLAGRPGPFVYGDYSVYDRVEGGPAPGIFRAVHLPSSQPVCLYFLTGPSTQDPSSFAAIAQLVATAGRIQSPHVLACHELVDLGRFRFIAIADLPARTLKDAFALGPMASAEACRLARQIALALAQIHQQGQVYGELWPGNVFLDAARNVKLLFVPLWRDVLAGATGPASGAARLANLATYLSPEVAAGQPPDARSDVYSLGCLLYQMLCGQPPFAGGGAAATLARQATEPVMPLQQRNLAVPLPVAQVVGYMLEKSPQARYQQASNVADALLAYIEPAARAMAQEQPTASSIAYEAWLRQRASGATPSAARPVPVPSSAAAPTAGAAPPAPPAPVAAPGWSHVTGPTAAPPAAPAAVVLVAPFPASSGPVVAAPLPGGSAALASHRATRGMSRRNQTVLVVSGVLVLAALVLIGLFNMGGNGPGNTVSGDGTTGGTPGTTNTSSTGGSIGSNSTGSNTGANTGGASTTSGGTTETPNGGASTPTPAVAAREVPVAESIDGSGPIWDSPTAGPPLELTYLPPGAQIVVALRPADILANPHGPIVLETLRELGTFARENALKVGVPWENIELVVIGVYDAGGGKPPKTAVCAKTREKVEQEAWLKAIGDAQYDAERKIYVAGPVGYHLSDDGRRVVAAPIEPFQPGAGSNRPIDDALANDKGLQFRRELESLRRFTDENRLFSVLFAPQFLFTGGKTIWDGPQQVLREPIELGYQLPDKYKAGLFSVHFAGEEHLFLELHLYGTADAAPTMLARDLADKIKVELPKKVEEYYFSLDPSPYSKKILFRFPLMMKTLAERTEVGTVDKHPVARCYLPLFAASSLTEATYLALVERGGGGGTAVPVGPAPMAEPKGALEILKTKKTDLSFTKDTLEKSVEMLSNDIGVPIEILGADLQIEGITKNQSFGLDEKGKTAGEILRAIMLKANMDNKLVYIVKKEGDKEVLQITTRAAAAKRGDKLPPELELKPEKKS